MPRRPDLRRGWLCVLARIVSAMRATIPWESDPSRSTTWIPAQPEGGTQLCPRMLWAGPLPRPPREQVRLLLRMRGLLPLQSPGAGQLLRVGRESCDSRTGHMRGWSLRQEPRRWEDGCTEQQGEDGVRPERQGAAWRD